MKELRVIARAVLGDSEHAIEASGGCQRCGAVVSESDFQTFIGAHAGIRDQLSPSVIAKEKTAIEAHKSTVGKMEASDGARVIIGDTLSEIGDGFAKAIGNISGKLIGGIGSVLGQGVASALGSLGPVGVVVGVGLIATYAYKKTR